jgi:two-component system sensor histidine kinase KdpD
MILTGVASGAAYLLHFNLPAVGPLNLLLVVLVALRWGLAEATIVSLTAVLCLDYFFIPPIFNFTVTDPQNWVSLATFEVTALLVSGLSSKVRLHAAQAELQRMRTATLYELSRAILLIDGRTSTIEQLSTLIREFLHVEFVDLWAVNETDPTSASKQLLPQKGSALETYLEDKGSDDPQSQTSRRLLKLGTTSIGAMVLRGWETDPLLADAVASLAAVALERARAIQKESRAEAGRNTEQLRTTVLDGLAHGFKTPLTAIQTASSGLLAIGQLTETQAELVSIIDEEATMLSRLTTRLLQTAALDATEIRLRRSKISLISLLQGIVKEQQESIRARIKITAQPGVVPVEVDAQMIELALLQLIDNAVKYSTVSSTIDVAITQHEQETLIVVTNQGSSIKPEERERIFERFYRSSDTIHGPTGTGLGLSIVKKTAEAHGGRVSVECEGDCTRFLFTMHHYEGNKNG